MTRRSMFTRAARGACVAAVAVAAAAVVAARARAAPGDPDPAFGHGGIESLKFPFDVAGPIDDRPGLQFSFVSALAVLPDGRVLAAGLAGDSQGRTFLALAR